MVLWERFFVLYLHGKKGWTSSYGSRRWMVCSRQQVHHDTPGAREFSGLEWIWHKLLLEKTSLCMWKARFHYLFVDSRVQQCGTQLASRCDCCIIGKLRHLKHVLCLVRILHLRFGTNRKKTDNGFWVINSLCDFHCLQYYNTVIYIQM